MQATKQQVLLWAALFLFLAAVVLHHGQLFHMAAAAAALWPISLLLARLKLKGLDVQRSAPRSLNVGEVGEVQLRLINPGSTRRLFVEASDEVPEQAGSDRPRFVVPLLEGGSEVELNYTFQPTLRGVYRLGPARLEAADTLGLSRFTRRLDNHEEIIVYPTPLNLPPLWPTASGSRQPHRPMRQLGQDGLDLHGIRSYVPGDDPRRIHWKTSARTGELMTIQMAREQSLEGVIILDLCRNDHKGTGLFSTLEQGVLVAATAARQARHLGADTGLVAVGVDDYTVPTARGVDRYHAILEALARAQTAATDNWPDAIIERLSAMPLRSAALVISPRTDTTALELARHLVARRHQVSWLLLYSEDERSGFEERLQSIGCRVRSVDCSHPLVSQFAGSSRVHATV